VTEFVAALGVVLVLISGAAALHLWRVFLKHWREKY